MSAPNEELVGLLQFPATLLTGSLLLFATILEASAQDISEILQSKCALGGVGNPPAALPLDSDR